MAKILDIRNSDNTLLVVGAALVLPTSAYTATTVPAGSVRYDPGTTSLQLYSDGSWSPVSGSGPTGPTGPTGPAGPAGTAGTLGVNQIGAVSGTTFSLDITDNKINTMTLNNSLSSFSITLDLSGANFTIVIFAITQGASGGPFTITWPGNFIWQGGYAPALSTAAGAMDVIQLTTFNSGSTWLASISIQVPAP